MFSPRFELSRFRSPKMSFAVAFPKFIGITDEMLQKDDVDYVIEMYLLTRSQIATLIENVLKHRKISDTLFDTGPE